MPRKNKNVKKVEDMSQAHGKVEKPVYSTLDQIWGDSGIQKYGTFDENEYLSKIKDMTKSDIQAHANRMGLIPIDNRAELEKRLLKEFVYHKIKYTAKVPENIQMNNIEGNLSPEIKKILSEGK